MKNIIHKVRIGTSGIVVPSKKQDYPEEYKDKSRLRYYSSLYNTVEINSSFHKIPLSKTFTRWADEVMEDFIFTVKLWRGITHNRKLVFELEDIDTFINASNNIGNKKGCLLLQFPASITNEYLQEVQKILERISVINHVGWQICIELRHKSWYQPESYEMLNKYAVSLVFHDIDASMPPQVNLESKVIYFRFHGPQGDYRGSYSDKFLKDQADYIKCWLSKGKIVFAYFNNTMGSAFENSQLLQKLVKQGQLQP